MPAPESPFRSSLTRALLTVLLAVAALSADVAAAGTRTWDGQHDTSRIEVTVVYFVPSDRKPLADWQARAQYYCTRIEKFHRREFGEQSVMTATLHPEPLVSEQSTTELREGDADQIYFRTLRETDRRLQFAREQSDAFPILLVLSEINWRSLNDWYRVHPKDDGSFEFEGNYSNGRHFPGATSGGARAAYLARDRKGWGLVSADGWRVPYTGSDCVAYHEGCGHTVGLPHPEPANDSVMSLAQYRGNINESYLDKDQKVRLQWDPTLHPSEDDNTLFTRFTAVPEPRVPAPGQTVNLRLTWPENCRLGQLQVEIQTELRSEWKEIPQPDSDSAPATVTLGVFDGATPVAYRISAVTEDGTREELWGYLQVRDDPNQPVMPPPGTSTAGW